MKKLISKLKKPRPCKPAETLRPSDFQKFPVWTYLNDDALGETMAAPVKKLPALTLDSCLAGTKVKLANGREVWSCICNVASNSPRHTRHFMCVSFFQDDEVFHLARYQDPNYNRHGPDALARFLKLDVEDIFPIAYDLTGLCRGDPLALSGTIEKVPSERLSKDELMEMIFEKLRTSLPR